MHPRSIKELNVGICEEKQFFSIDAIFRNDPERNYKEIETAFYFEFVLVEALNNLLPGITFQLGEKQSRAIIICKAGLIPAANE